MDRKTLLILVIIFALAALLGQSFIQPTDVYANPRGGYTTAEISSAVVVVNGGTILEARYDSLIIRATEPHVLINILGSGFERVFTITVQNINPGSISIEGDEPGSLTQDTSSVRFTATVPPRLVKDIRLSPQEENVPFAVLGDSRDNPLVFRSMLDMIESSDARFIIHLGDIVSEGTEEEYEEVVQTMEGTPLPIYTVPGNHDILGHGRSHYSREFGMYYHSFDTGNSHFVMLDNANGRLGDDQLKWLRDDLDKNKGSLIMVFMHMPPFDPRPGQTHAMQRDAEAVVSLFEEFGVDTVFSAHIHSYHEYTRGGVRYIITGGGGAPPVDNGVHHYVLARISDGNITTEMRTV